MWLSLLLFLHNVVSGARATVRQCCQEHGVSETCARMLCNPQNPPNDFDVYNIFERKINCLPFLDAISECLADGRDHIHCCLSEAKDRDENACFGMCRGEGTDGVAAWDKYQTCLAINLQPMFRCFERGYLNSPTSPQSVHVVSRSADSVLLAWSPPAINSELAESYQVVCKEADDSGSSEKIINTRGYKVVCKEADDSGSSEKIINTRGYKVTLTGLHAGSRYSVHVIAVTRDGRHRSLPSQAVHFYTSGVAPRANAYRESVAVPETAFSVTIACRMEMPGTIHKSVHVEWRKVLQQTGRYEKLTGDKYSFTNYVTSHEYPRHYVSALQIKFLKESDFGTYRCTASNDFGSSSADIQVLQRTLTSATPVPPEPPYTCCQRLGIRSPCVAVCGSEFGKRASLRAESFINSRCEDEIGKFLTCTTAGVDEGACCLRKKVPGICLPLCDGSQMSQLDTIPHECATYTFSIFQCRMENADSRPATVSGLKAIPNSDGLLLRWDLTPRADVYHVYWKRRFGTKWEWEVSSVLTASKRIAGADDIDEIVVVASNSFGNAHPARLIHLDNKWIASYLF
ncbi:unnamed protein product [Gongylonema pulchrum]|uniref:Fibronectin type III domain-containing protein 7 n=1 Tax=Gongylonema pulchrum TaxID=637853 RepID=A0A183DQZ7_9BILA|nr:unnamed protein product [Gongylonema pulchrum]